MFLSPRRTRAARRRATCQTRVADNFARYQPHQAVLAPPVTMSTSAAMRTFTYKYHAGKLAVQRRAGTAEEAGRIFESGFVGTKIR